ncbi:hypothetical protein GMDG_01323 [Pseudogymnoascus destructans 20631-21]|uniref:Uncharacterized protein n=1 Tax=Pseudogymnoascus destructans (strain ATCC MYA-4855 / 20631-21) TaxID=658429 RepID=L8FTA2_PSED2|nr:hypothetical protein GMDG_01323 [Pseudogymnoascus destructans 20631-21]
MASSNPSKKESKKAVAAKPAKASKTAAKKKEAERSMERIADSDIDMDDASSEEGSDSNDEAGSVSGPDEETSSSGSESEGGSGSGSESESEEELPVKVTAPRTTLPKRSKNPSPAPTPAAQHTSRPAPFAPPKGYTPLPASSTTNKLLTPAALANRQIWHITAPASLSLASLKNLSLPARTGADEDAPTISLPGGEYSVVLAAATADTTRVLLPGKGGYKALAAPVERTLHLQRVNVVGGETYVGRKREARKQPGGLRMRFRPIGFGEGGECGEIGGEEEGGGGGGEAAV